MSAAIVIGFEFSIKDYVSHKIQLHHIFWQSSLALHSFSKIRSSFQDMNALAVCSSKHIKKYEKQSFLQMRAYVTIHV